MSLREWALSRVVIDCSPDDLREDLDSVSAHVGHQDLLEARSLLHAVVALSTGDVLRRG